MDSMQSSPLVLVVDDDRDGREAYSVGLQAEGFRVEEASDGFEAVDKGFKLRPQVILMDLLMPRLDGWQVVSWLKKNPITQQIPIVAVSGAGADLKQVALDAGCRMVIDKPVTPERLAEEIRRVLESGL